MVFSSDRQRKGFFASRGNIRSNVTPSVLPPRAETQRFVRLRRAGFNVKDSTRIAKSRRDTQLALSIQRKARR